MEGVRRHGGAGAGHHNNSFFCVSNAKTPDFTLRSHDSMDAPHADFPPPPDGALLAAVAGAVGTPVYVSDARTIVSAYRALDAALAGWPHAVHYALKANSTLAIV